MSQHHGWSDTEQEATDAARAVVERLATADVVVAQAWHSTARNQLKLINAERQRARPPKPYRGGTDPAPVQHLYGTDWRPTSYTRYGEPIGERRVIVEFRIIKKTAKRIYYSRDTGGMTEQERARGGYVDRQEIERNGHVRTSRGWWAIDSILYLDPPDLGQSTPGDRAEEVSRLKAEMADAHPDRGGDRDTFQAARTRYENAKRTAS